MSPPALGHRNYAELPVSPARILVVDDRPTNRAIVRAALLSREHEVFEAAGGQEALALIFSQPLDLVVLDVLMPDLDGLEVLQVVRQSRSASELPVIMVTVKHESDDIVQAIELGANDFVPKPIDVPVLCARIQTQLAYKRAEDALRRAHEQLEQRIEERTGELVETNEILRSEVRARERANERARFQAQLLDSVRESVVATDLAGRVIYWGKGAQSLYGHHPKEAVGRSLFLLTQNGDGDQGRSRTHAVRAEGSWAGEYTQQRKDGTTFWAESFISLVSGDDGEPVGLVSIDRDVTERKRAERALRDSENRFRALYDENPSMFFTVDLKGAILSANQAGARELGYAAEELVGVALSSLHPRNESEKVERQLRACIAEPERVHRWEVRTLRRDNTLLWLRETARVISGVTDETATVLIVCEDCTEAHDLSEQLSYQASHDALTGLVNRRAFENRLERVLETARRHHTTHALCYLDLDQFKVINDTCGHVAGDELLRQLSRYLSAQVRKRDTLARLGGDEFGVLMERCSLEQARRVAEALRKAIESFRFLWEEKSFSVGVSIGLVPVTRASEHITGVLRAADNACYAAKDTGRNRIHVYHEADAELVKRHREMQWVVRMNRALEEDRFHLSFQPIVPIDGGSSDWTHYELLLWMEDEDGRILPPGAFLPAAERYNLAARLDRWVIDAAFEWLTRHPAHLEDLSLCAINLSGHSLGDQKFLDSLIDRFRERAIPANKICFEITETAAISNLADAARFVKALKALGCRFALDDFGSGLSSFAYLKTLPVDFLKIDGMFVRDITDDPVNLTMVRSINEIGQVMGKQTVAEFVESEAVLEKLREIGVDYAQGYFMGRPRPLEEITVSPSDELVS